MHHAPPGPHPPLSPYDTTKEEEKNEQDLTRYQRSERTIRKERFSVVVVVILGSVFVVVVVVLLLFVRVQSRIDSHRVSTDGDQTLETSRTPLPSSSVPRASTDPTTDRSHRGVKDRNRAEKPTILIDFRRGEISEGVMMIAF